MSEYERGEARDICGSMKGLRSDLSFQTEDMLNTLKTESDYSVRTAQ